MNGCMYGMYVWMNGCMYGMYVWMNVGMYGMYVVLSRYPISRWGHDAIRIAILV